MDDPIFLALEAGAAARLASERTLPRIEDLHSQKDKIRYCRDYIDFKVDKQTQNRKKNKYLIRT
jgi:hypothetical protein